MHSEWWSPQELRSKIVAGSTVYVTTVLAKTELEVQHFRGRSPAGHSAGNGVYMATIRSSRTTQFNIDACRLRTEQCELPRDRRRDAEAGLTLLANGTRFDLMDIQLRASLDAR